MVQKTVARQVTTLVLMMNVKLKNRSPQTNGWRHVSMWTLFLQSVLLHSFLFRMPLREKVDICSSQMSSIRAEKKFPPCESDIADDQVKPMLDWANEGFLPKGEEGLKPTHTAGEQGSCTKPVAYCPSQNKVPFSEIMIVKSDCSCVPRQTATLWTTRSSMFPCQSISPAPSGPESASVGAGSPPPRSPTAEVHFYNAASLWTFFVIWHIIFL